MRRAGAKLRRPRATDSSAQRRTRRRGLISPSGDQTSGAQSSVSILATSVFAPLRGIDNKECRIDSHDPGRTVNMIRIPSGDHLRARRSRRYASALDGLLIYTVRRPRHRSCRRPRRATPRSGCCRPNSRAPGRQAAGRRATGPTLDQRTDRHRVRAVPAFRPTATPRPRVAGPLARDVMFAGARHHPASSR